MKEFLSRLHINIQIALVIGLAAAIGAFAVSPNFDTLIYAVIGWALFALIVVFFDDVLEWLMSRKGKCN